MQKNDLFRQDGSVFRILAIQGDSVLAIDCLKRTMPQWITLESAALCTEAELRELTDIELFDLESLDPATKRVIHERFTLVAGVLPFLADEKIRTYAIKAISEEKGISTQTLRNYLCLYLAFQDLSALAPKRTADGRALTKDEKNMRWALNRYFYTQHKNSLNTAYAFMLREKYTDAFGTLISGYPTFNQFRYFYRKTRRMQTYYISRNGLKSYQRNNRPLTGDGVQQFAQAIGVGMLDSTICDIYLVDDAHNLIGRPVLTACVDAFSGLCCGYSLSWEGGVYSLRGLMLNTIADKQKWCRRFGISISKAEWPCCQLPATLVTDMGAEYKSSNFEQIAELGVTVVNLPAYRPELKGTVEKFFDVIQGLFKPYLKGKGTIEPDFQERGAHDYRKDACMTKEMFETVLLYCILYYNSKRILENFPYSGEMLAENVPPHSSDIRNWSANQQGANLISVTKEQLILTLLPRTTATFTRYGLKVNQLRYDNKDYTEAYLNGGAATVAYNPDDVSAVWLLDKGRYIPFDLIESRFQGKELPEVKKMRESQREIARNHAEDSLQAKLQLVDHIAAIANHALPIGQTATKSIRKNRERAQRESHIDIVREGIKNG